MVDYVVLEELPSDQQEPVRIPTSEEKELLERLVLRLDAMLASPLVSNRETSERLREVTESLSRAVSAQQSVADVDRQRVAQRLQAVEEAIENVQLALGDRLRQIQETVGKVEVQSSIGREIIEETLSERMAAVTDNMVTMVDLLKAGNDVYRSVTERSHTALGQVTEKLADLEQRLLKSDGAAVEHASALQGSIAQVASQLSIVESQSERALSDVGEFMQRLDDHKVGTQESLLKMVDALERLAAMRETLEEFPAYFDRMQQVDEQMVSVVRESHETVHQRLSMLEETLVQQFTALASRLDIGEVANSNKLAELAGHVSDMRERLEADRAMAPQGEAIAERSEQLIEELDERMTEQLSEMTKRLENIDIVANNTASLAEEVGKLRSAAENAAALSDNGREDRLSELVEQVRALRERFDERTASDDQTARTLGQLLSQSRELELSEEVSSAISSIMAEKLEHIVSSLQQAQNAMTAAFQDLESKVTSAGLVSVEAKRNASDVGVSIEELASEIAAVGDAMKKLEWKLEQPSREDKEKLEQLGNVMQEKLRELGDTLDRLPDRMAADADKKLQENRRDMEKKMDRLEVAFAESVSEIRGIMERARERGAPGDALQQLHAYVEREMNAVRELVSGVVSRIEASIGDAEQRTERKVEDIIAASSQKFMELEEAFRESVQENQAERALSSVAEQLAELSKTVQDAMNALRSEISAKTLRLEEDVARLSENDATADMKRELAEYGRRMDNQIGRIRDGVNEAIREQTKHAMAEIKKDLDLSAQHMESVREDISHIKSVLPGDVDAELKRMIFAIEVLQAKHKELLNRFDERITKRPSRMRKSARSPKAAQPPARRQAPRGAVRAAHAQTRAALIELADSSILDLLRKTERMNIQQIINAVPVSRSLAKKRLVVLNRAGRVKRQKEGRNVFYAAP